MLKPREEELTWLFPGIEWLEPLAVSTPVASGLACRFCIAFAGLKGQDVSKLPQTREEFNKHMEVHSMAQ